MHTYDVVVIGAGWAGLSVSYRLTEAGFRHVVLERGRIGETWRTQRWKSFRMNTPNVLTVLPGDQYTGPDPEGFMTGEDFAAMLDEYVERNNLPVRRDVQVKSVRRAGDDFEIRTNEGTIRSHTVVVASGNLNVPRRPALADRLPTFVVQMDGTEYTEPDAVPDGAVLVVGCGDTGGQIAEELAQAGRKVFLATGRNGRIPRGYRGRDIFLWMSESGLNRRPRKPGASRALVGRKGTLSLQSLSALGVRLTGRLQDVSTGGAACFDDSLLESAAFADELSEGLKTAIDEYIAREKIDAPVADPDRGETVQSQFPDPPISELDLRGEGIGTVIWATGLGGDFSWLEVPGTLDAAGEPLQERSVSAAGVYFAGIDNPEAQRSGTVLVADVEAKRIVRHIAAGHPKTRSHKELAQT